MHLPNGRTPALILLLVGLVAAACSSSDLALPDPTSPSSSTPTTEPATEGTGSSTDLDSLVPAFPEPAIDDTPIEIDPAVRTGTLTNGLTYYARRNHWPGGNIELRLVVRAGSLQQVELDGGTAHFLEHMLFNGTEAYPRNTLENDLNSLGATIGPHLNAYTSFGETVYLLRLPVSDSGTLDTGFTVLREWAARATLDIDEVVNERGVVLEEFRLAAADPGSVVDEVFDELYLAGTPYEHADPIGTAEQITSTDSEVLRTFYDDWYRPELMAVIAVGDVPVDELEQRIADTFGELMPRGDTPERVEVDVALIDEPRARTVVDPAQSTKFISLDYTLPVWDSDTVGGERLELIEGVMALMIQNRLTESSATGRSDLITPSVGAYPLTDALRILGFNADAPHLAEGLRFMVTELNGIRVAGFGEAELDRAATAVRAGLESQLTAAASTQDGSYADLYAAHFLRGAEAGAAQDRVERIRRLLDELDADAINDHYRWVMANSAPLAALVGQDAERAGIPSEEELHRLLIDAEAAGLGGEAGVTTDIEELTELMTPPDAVESETVPTMEGASAWRFANGVTVVFTPSQIRNDGFDIHLRSGGGYSTLELADAPFAGLAASAVGASGFSGHSRVAIDRFLADSTAFVYPYIAETREGFFGSADNVDAEELFQIIHLLVTEPSIDDSGLREAINDAEAGLRDGGTDPDTILYNALLDVRWGGAEVHRRLTQPDLDAVDSDRLLRIYRDRLGAVDDLVVAVAGDIDEDELRSLAEKYLGTLPTGPSDTWIDVQPPIPDGISTVAVSGGRADGAAGVAYGFNVEMEIDVDDRVAADVLTIILDERLFDAVREELGATYGGSVILDSLLEPDEGFSAFIIVQGDPSRIDLIRQTVLDNLADIVDNGVRADELQRAIQVASSDYDYHSNPDLMNWMLEFEEHPGEDHINLYNRQSVVRSISAADVNFVARALFGSGDRVEAVRTAG